MTLLRLPIRLVKAVPFLVWFLWELIVANAMVAWEVLTPTHYMRPGIIRCPVSGNDTEVTLLANLISLTPGTISLEIAADRSAIFVHALHLRTPDHLRETVANYERRLLWVLR
ncbi:MAG TPA: Na+/H+ antiporter subunit E [Actinomycetota bacterium]|nr:Na+/H+ antiporter subunit E [Actinomycetota bacterium]